MKSDDAARIGNLVRGQSRGEQIGIATLARAAEELEIQLTRPIYEQLTYGHRFGTSGLPEELVAFVERLADRRSPKTVTQLWAGDGKLALRLANSLADTSVTGIEPNSDSIDVAKFFDSESRVSWIHARPGNLELGDFQEAVDLLIVSGPLGMKGDPITVRTETGAQVRLSDDVTRLDLVRWVDAVSVDGTALLLTTNSIFWSDASKKTLTALSRGGLYLNAAIALPAGTFAPMTSIPATLAIFGRTPTPTIFMAELPKDPQAQERLIVNMEAMKSAKSPSNGILLERDMLAPLDTIIAGLESQRDLAATGLDVQALREVALDFRGPVRDGDEWVFKPADNSFYMPLVGSGPVRLEVPAKISKEWVQAALDPSKAVAAYVARWLTSPLGRRVRETHGHGTVMLRMKFSDVGDLSVPLPSLMEQYTSLELDRRLTLLAADIHQLQDDLLNKPKKMPEIFRAVHKLKEEDDLASWFESLPLPLSTIGRVYYARKDVRERVEALFHFFEATAEFHAAILLSGMSADAAFYEQSRDALLGSAEQRRKYFEKPTIGGWITMCLTLSKRIRRYMGQPDEQGVDVGREAVLRWFGRPDPRWMDSITDKALYEALDQARERRNDWKGHGGAVGEAINKSRLVELEELLATVRTRIGDSWDDVRLVSPIASVYEDQIFSTTVDLLVGSRVPFLQDSVGTIAPLENGSLHLIHSTSLSSMKLLPLVRMMPAPRTATNTCYFYNRVDGNDVRYISYYYAEDPEARMSAGDTASDVVLDVLGLTDRG